MPNWRCQRDSERRQPSPKAPLHQAAQEASAFLYEAAKMPEMRGPPVIDRGLLVIAEETHSLLFPVRGKTCLC
jgi:hypothetical protein